MKDTNEMTKKNRITYTATRQGIERAEQALRRLGFGSKLNFANCILISRSTVNKFFHQKPIQLDSFQQICEKLELLDWKEIADMNNNENAIENNNEQFSGRRNTFLDRECLQTIEAIEQENQINNNHNNQLFSLTPEENGNYRVTVKLRGDIQLAIQESMNIKRSLEEIGESIEVIDIVEGCIKLTLRGSKKDIIKLIEQIQSKDISEIAGFPIIDKWELIQELKQNSPTNHNFKEFDFSDANLSNVNFHNIDLQKCDFSNADLSNADLSNADLSNADLSNADLSGANLSNADLSGANLNRVNLKYTKIDQTSKIDEEWRKVWEFLNLEKTNQEIFKLFDDLTQMPNRRYFDRYFQQEWKRSQREKSPISLLLCDLDYFKSYNESYGYLRGDYCLTQVAQIIQEIPKRPGDMVFRCGGEEFAIILPNTSSEGAEFIAKQIIQRIQEKQIQHLSSPISPYVSVSLGIAVIVPTQSSSRETLWAMADMALYHAKNRGRNTYYLEKN